MLIIGVLMLIGGMLRRRMSVYVQDFTLLFLRLGFMTLADGVHELGSVF